MSETEIGVVLVLLSILIVYIVYEIFKLINDTFTVQRMINSNTRDGKMSKQGYRFYNGIKLSYDRVQVTHKTILNDYIRTYKVKYFILLIVTFVGLVISLSLEVK